MYYWLRRLGICRNDTQPLTRTPDSASVSEMWRWPLNLMDRIRYFIFAARALNTHICENLITNYGGWSTRRFDWLTDWLTISINTRCRARGRIYDIRATAAGAAHEIRSNSSLFINCNQDAPYSHQIRLHFRCTAIQLNEDLLFLAQNKWNHCKRPSFRFASSHASHKWLAILFSVAKDIHSAYLPTYRYYTFGVDNVDADKNRTEKTSDDGKLFARQNKLMGIRYRWVWVFDRSLWRCIS